MLSVSMCIFTFLNIMRLIRVYRLSLLLWLQSCAGLTVSTELSSLENCLLFAFGSSLKTKSYFSLTSYVNSMDGTGKAYIIVLVCAACANPNTIGCPKVSA